MEGWKPTPIGDCKNILIESQTQGLYKWKDGSLVPPWTIQMEGQKPSHIKDCRNGMIEAQSNQILYIGRMAATSRQVLCKLKDGSQVQTGTVQMEDKKLSPIRDYPNGRMETKSQGLQKWKVRSQVPSGTVHMEGQKISYTKDYTNGRVLYKWKDGSLSPSGTVKMEGQNPSPIRDCTNERIEAQSHQELYKWRMEACSHQ